MRKLLTLVIVAFLSFNSYSQSWMDLGLKGGWGLNFLYNKNILDDADMNERFSTGFTFGGKLGWNFNDSHELTIDVMYGKFSQAYKYNVTDSATGASPEYDRSFSFTGLNFLLLYRHNNDGRYAEIGPMYSTISNVTLTDEFFNTIDYDFKQHANPGYFGLAFGFGGYLVGTENFGITMGARFTYSFGDSFADDGMNFPAMKTYTSYTPSHPITAMLIMEANLDFAYMAKAKCKNKRKLILF